MSVINHEKIVRDDKVHYPVLNGFQAKGYFRRATCPLNSYRTHFNCLLIKGLRVIGGDESSSSCKDKRTSTFSLVQVFGKSGGERSECDGNL